MIDWTDTNLVLTLGAAVTAAAVLGLGALAFAGMGSDRRARKRADALRERWTGSPKTSAAAISLVRRNRRDSGVAGIDWLIKRALPNPEKMRARLAATGQRINLGEYILFMLVLMGAVTLVIHMFVGLSALVSGLIGVAVGAWLPHMTVGFLMTRRLNKFTALFPEAIDLIVRGLKSGLPVSESIRTVGVEVPDPIGVEFRTVTDAVSLGLSLEEALWDAAKRLDTPEFKFFVVTLSIQRETGGNLAETLANLADILRRRRHMRLKIKAMSSEARASAYILGSLPFVVFAAIMIINPGYAMQLFQDPRGHYMLGAGFASLATGALVMAKMIRFEI
jgi:tight adherence protein B